jgi:carbamoylphosphate synthase small subunit
MNGPLVNIGDLSKPATVFIEKISDAVGGVAKPWQLTRVAKAEAKADIIRSQAKIEISELERRALERMVREEGKKQENIESIAEKTIPLLSQMLSLKMSNPIGLVMFSSAAEVYQTNKCKPFGRIY